MTIFRELYNGLMREKGRSEREFKSARELDNRGCASIQFCQQAMLMLTLETTVIFLDLTSF